MGVGGHLALCLAGQKVFQQSLELQLQEQVQGRQGPALKPKAGRKLNFPKFQTAHRGERGRERLAGEKREK